MSLLLDISLLAVKYLPRPLVGMGWSPSSVTGREDRYTAQEVETCPWEKWEGKAFPREVPTAYHDIEVWGWGDTLGHYSVLDILGPLASCFSIPVNFCWMPVSSSLNMSCLPAVICSSLKSWEWQLAILQGFPQTVSAACLEPPIWWSVHLCHPLLSFYFRLLNIMNSLFQI